jgi:hypothetical protein
MSDTELHDLLVRVADQVTPVDLLPRVRARVRVRKQRRVLLAVASTAVVVVAVVAGATHLAAGTGRPVNTVSTPSPTPTPDPTALSGPRSTKSVTPTYLPVGVTQERHRQAKRHGDHPRPPVPGKEANFHLPGSINANTEPPGGASASDLSDRAIHPGTDLAISFVPTIHKLPSNVAFARSEPDFSVRTVTIAGNRAFVTISHAEHAAFRIDWIDTDGYHVLIEDRIITSQGISGLGLDTMLRIARSLYQ